MKEIQEMDISVKTTRKRGITIVPTLIIDTLQVHVTKNIISYVYVTYHKSLKILF